MDAAVSKQTSRRFPCNACGGDLRFEPGTLSLTCSHCGNRDEIPPSESPLEELDFHQYLAEVSDEQTTETLTVHCNTCGAETTLAPNITAARCPFCGSAIVAQALSKRLIKPNALLPFHITHEQAADAFRQWISSLWFAPTLLKKRAERADISGVFIPSWTYDSNTTTTYTGQRGDDYWVTETYTTIMNGKPVLRTRQVRHTRWSYASGVVNNSFDDVLVLASASLPEEKARQLEPWNLPDLLPYQDEYLAGMIAENYQIDLAQGFESAKQIMAGTIAMTIGSDIGGDRQRIETQETVYEDVTFKHALLPVWISAYRFGDRAFRFLVNARTGEIQGERPYSVAKIIGAITLGIFVILLLLLLVQMRA